MSWYAIDSVDDALDATRSFLLPFRLREWLILGLIAVFVGVGGGTGLSSLSTSTGPSTGPSTDAGDVDGQSPSELVDTLLPAVFSEVGVGLIIGVAALLISIVLVVSLISDTLRFVLYDSLHTNRIRLREPVRRRFGQALGLFGFKLGVQAVTIGPIVFGVLFVVFGPSELGLADGAWFAVLGLFALAALGLWLGSVVVLRITDEFVVPTMVVTDSGVLDGWRRFWPVLRGQLPQFGVYLVVHFLLLLGIGIGYSIVALLVYGIVLTIGAVIGLVLVFGIFGSVAAVTASIPAIIALVALAVLTLLVGYVLLLPIQIVVLTYVVTYEVSVLGAADTDLALLASASQPESDHSAPVS